MSEIRPFHRSDGTPLLPGDRQSFFCETSDPTRVLEATGCSNQSEWFGQPPDSITLAQIRVHRHGHAWLVEATVCVHPTGTAGTISPVACVPQTFRTHKRADFDAVFAGGPYEWLLPEPSRDR